MTIQSALLPTCYQQRLPIKKPFSVRKLTKAKTATTMRKVMAVTMTQTLMKIKKTKMVLLLNMIRQCKVKPMRVM